jgi:hypothetical protein
MIERSPELCLLAHCFDGVYRVAALPKPVAVNWARFQRLVHNNKLSLLAYTRVLDDRELSIPGEWRARFAASKVEQEQERQKFAPSLSQVNTLLGDTPYALLKTYRSFPYFTHDVDVLVEDVDAVGRTVTEAGIPWFAIPRGSVQIEEPQWLDLEFYGRALPGSIQVIDDGLSLKDAVPMTLEGVPVTVASPELEAVTLIADAVFRLYEMKLGDMVYIYTLANRVDWALLESQAEKHGWRGPFRSMVGVLNAYHRELYGEPSSIESAIDIVTPVSAHVPYVPGWRATIRALSSKGLRHLIKLPSYVSVLLKHDHPRLHGFYIRFFQVPVGRFVLRHLYR